MPEYSILRPGTDGYLTGFTSSGSPDIFTLRVVLSPTSIAGSSSTVSSCAGSAGAAAAKSTAALNSMLPVLFKMPPLVARALLPPDLAFLKRAQDVLHLLAAHLVLAPA